MEPAPRYRKRVKHYDRQGDAHFLTFSSYRRLALLSKDRTRQWFLEALENSREKHGFDLWAWVIMPEHVHLLILLKNADSETAKILASIKRPVGYRAIEYLKQEAPAFLERLTVHNRNRTYHHFWQPGAGFDKNLSEPGAIHNAVDYIHANPVRRELAKRPIDWPWSSSRDWEGVEHPHLVVDRTLPVLHPDGQ